MLALLRDASMSRVYCWIECPLGLGSKGVELRMGSCVANYSAFAGLMDRH